MRGLTSEEARVLALSLPGQRTTHLDEYDAQVADRLVERGLLVVSRRRRRSYWITNARGVLALRVAAMTGAEATK